ncbi:MAG: hypothetical protein Q7K71_04080 [Candidatus Omnitrophota bacterium]|nr:hypothetical protein [Candidatus Omnitrophota bacterium]
MRTHWVARNRGRAVIEYALLIAIILAALFWMKGPIVRAFYGRWKTAGDSFAFGRQYDPKRTVECAHDTATRTWYDERCFDNGRRACVTAVDVAACEAGIIQGCSGNCREPNSDPYY